MSDTERAIEYCECVIKNPWYGDNMIQHAAVCLQALRAQTEQSKGCEYCTGEVGKMERHMAYKFPRGWVVETELVFCPMCGKPLSTKEDE